MKYSFNHTKIIATIGPASSSKEVLEKMIRAGVNICRINASHGAHSEHIEVIKRIREINDQHNINTGILFDLQGPKLRVGKIKDNEIWLEEKRELQLTTEEKEGTTDSVTVRYSGFAKDVSPGDPILIDDGKIELQVLNTNKKDTVTTKIIHGGVLSSNKGVNLPYTKISLPSLTEKDLADLDFALKCDFEWIGLSFVRSANDVVDLKERIKKANGISKVVAKIEKPEAIKDIDNIIKVSDGIMVARGDLGVEMLFEQVPLIQKMLVKKCLAQSKPIIIATQMMESMISAYSPTRAEVNDVGNSVMDGADALMLSGETSVGRHPVRVIESMKKIISMVEHEDSIFNKPHPPNPASKTFIADSVCHNACLIAEQAGAKAIIAMTHSGYTAFKISSHRPRANIFIFTDNKPMLNTLNLVWGVKGFYYDRYESTDQTIADISIILKNAGYLSAKDISVHVASIPIKEKGRANIIKLNEVD